MPTINKPRLCVCGLDHNKPMPDVFNDPPIVYVSFSCNDSIKAVCHACGCTGPRDRSFFTDPSLHGEKCKYAIFLKRKKPCQQ